jgi:NUMOD3 motif
LGLKPRVSILQTCSTGQWQNWERFWIATVKAAGEKLLNLHPGGDGPLNPRAWNKGQKLSPEYRKKLSESHVGTLSSERAKAMAKKSSGHHKPHSPETKAKMRAAKLGKKQTAEHRAKVSSYFIGRRRDPATMKWL